VLDAHPDAVLLFVEHPHPESTPLSVSRKTRKRVERDGRFGSSVRFESWRPYENRFELPQVSDLAIITHRPGLETDLSLRTRLVDLTWLGLPAVVTAGGTMARVIEGSGAGLVVPPSNAGELAEAICGLLADKEARKAASAAGREWAAERTWKRMAAPLLHFAEKPWRDPSRERFENLAPGGVAAEEPLLRRIQRALRRQGRDR
jgi:glycosyltransferase involved in cell wall biosynthesis